MKFAQYTNGPLRWVDNLVGWSAGACLLTITVVLFTNSMARYFAGVAIIGGGELARFLMVWLTFLGSYLLVRIQRHVSVDILPQLISEGATRILSTAVGIVGMFTMAYVAWIGWGLTELILNTNQVMSSLPVRRGWIYLAVPVGAGLMSLAYFVQILHCISNEPLPTAEEFGINSPEEDTAIEDSN